MTNSPTNIDRKALYPAEWGSFRIYTPESSPGHQLIWKRSSSFKKFHLLIALFICIVPYLAVKNMIERGPGFENIMVGSIAGLFAIVLLRNYFKPGKKIVLDQKLGIFYFNENAPLIDNSLQAMGMPQLKDVMAIQILKTKRWSAVATDSDSSVSERRSKLFIVYELNFVMKNGLRENIMCHGHLASMRDDIKRMNLFLNVPVYEQDAIV